MRIMRSGHNPLNAAPAKLFVLSLKVSRDPQMDLKPASKPTRRPRCDDQLSRILKSCDVETWNIRKELHRFTPNTPIAAGVPHGVCKKRSCRLL